eukprot:SAG31_NODE_3420_length_4297_cov_4.123294_1_plen_73_part_00
MHEAYQVRSLGQSLPRCALGAPWQNIRGQSAQQYGNLTERLIQAGGLPRAHLVPLQRLGVIDVTMVDNTWCT